MKIRPTRARRVRSRLRHSLALSISSSVAAASLACGTTGLEDSFSEDDVVDVDRVSELAVGTYNVRIKKYEASPDGVHPDLTMDRELTFLDQAGTVGSQDFWRGDGKAAYEEIESVVFGADGWADQVVAALLDARTTFGPSNLQQLGFVEGGGLCGDSGSASTPAEREACEVHVTRYDAKTHVPSTGFIKPLQIPIGGSTCPAESSECETGAKYDPSFQVLACADANWEDASASQSDSYWDEPRHERWPYVCRSEAAPPQGADTLADQLDDAINAYLDSERAGYATDSDCWDHPLEPDAWDGLAWCEQQTKEVANYLRMSAIYLNHGVVRLSSHNQESLFTLSTGYSNLAGGRAIIFYASDHNSGPQSSWVEVDVSNVPRVNSLAWAANGLKRFMTWKKEDFGDGDVWIKSWNAFGFQAMIDALSSEVFGMKVADLAITTEPNDGEKHVEDINRLLEGGDITQPNLDIHMAVIDLPESAEEYKNLHLLLGSQHRHRMQDLYLLQMMVFSAPEQPEPNQPI